MEGCNKITKENTLSFNKEVSGLKKSKQNNRKLKRYTRKQVKKILQNKELISNLEENICKKMITNLEKGRCGIS